MRRIKRPTPFRFLVPVLGAVAFVLAACATEVDDVAVTDDADAVEPAEEPVDSDDVDEEAPADEPDPEEFSPPPILDDVPAEVAQACDTGGAIDEIRDRGRLNWAIGVSPPFGFKLADGEWAGVEAQNAAELAHILGVDEVEITDYSYDVLPNTVVAGQADIIGAQLFVTPDREAVIDFSVPYYLSGQLFYVLADSPYETIEDLNSPDVRFVYGTGGAQLDLAEQFIPEAQISDAPLRGQLLLYDMLAAGQADATMTEAAPMRVIFDRFSDPELAAIGMQGRVETERPEEDDMLDPFDVSFGLPPGDEAWAGCVNAWVTEALESGRMTERLEYWLDQDVA